MPDYISGNDAEALELVLEPMDGRRNYAAALKRLPVWTDKEKTWTVFPLMKTEPEALRGFIVSAAHRLGVEVEVFRHPEDGRLLYVRKTKEAAQ